MPVSVPSPGPLSTLPPGFPSCTLPPGFDPTAPLQNLDDPTIPGIPATDPTPLTTGRALLKNVTVDTSRIDSDPTLITSLDTSVSLATFNPFQVEKLLSECASLLERGITARNEYQALGEKSFATWLELSEFLALEDIHATEVTQGYYAVPAIMSATESNAQYQTTLGTSQAASAIHQWEALKTGADPADTAQNQVDRNSQFAEYTGEYNSASNRLIGYTSKAEYDSCDMSFQRQRTEAARRNSLAKLVAYTQPGGAYNYEERRSLLRGRFSEDFGDALARVGAIKTGLSLIYGAPWTMDGLLSPPPGGAQPMPAFDAALLAVRSALEWLVRFGIKEQNFILPISVKTLVGAQQWSDGFSEQDSNPPQTGIWEINIGPQFFPDVGYVRLRGVSATVDVTDTNGLYQVVFTVPQKGATNFSDWAHPGSPLDQSKLPMTRIGRVRPPNFQHPPDVVGTTSLVNASPVSYETLPGDVSTWRLGITSSQIPISKAQLAGGATNITTQLSTSNALIQDVTLYLYLAVVPSQ